MQNRRLNSAKQNYPRLRAIDGDHPFKERVPGGYVEYRARYRRGGKIAFFNFPLAKEMGLIPKSHPDEVTPSLAEALLETFALQIINEYDITHNTRIAAEDIKPKTYMATRYLQLQHPGRVGLTSGDGRSIWNGCTTDAKGRTWDISSCGTGATCLSPATALNKRFYKTGDKQVSYGCGYSMLSEGVIDVLTSEIFHGNDILSERALCVIEFPGEYAIKVRAGLNLLRPSHFFNHLRQGQFHRLKNAVDLFIERQVTNKTWQPVPRQQNVYRYLLQQVTATFARISAQFESEYIFCWMDWDGDNILADGGIVDFGSIRQFGLYHHEYRFDDVERWSTNIKEQKHKARAIVQTFAQLADYLISGKKKAFGAFSKAACLKEFDRIFKEHKQRLLLKKIGFAPGDVDLLMKHCGRDIATFGRFYYNFEMAKSKRGPVKVPDGISWNAIFCMRDILRVLPEEYSRGHNVLTAREFMNVIKSRYADRDSIRLTPYMCYKIRSFQKHYRLLVRQLAKRAGKREADIYRQLARRSAVINRYERITGDAICMIGENLVKQRKRLDSQSFHQLIRQFVADQILDPDRQTVISSTSARHDARLKELLNHANDLVKHYREGL